MLEEGTVQLFVAPTRYGPRSLSCFDVLNESIKNRMDIDRDMHIGKHMITMPILLYFIKHNVILIIGLQGPLKPLNTTARDLF